MRIPEKFITELRRRLHELALTVRNAEADVRQMQKVNPRTKEQQAQLAAAKDRLVEARRRLNLARTEYSVQKEISPDNVESAPPRTVNS
jgi:chromosome segregation and condensation protein ScpB